MGFELSPQYKAAFKKHLEVDKVEEEVDSVKADTTYLRKGNSALEKRYKIDVLTIFASGHGAAVSNATGSIAVDTGIYLSGDRSLKVTTGVGAFCQVDMALVGSNADKDIQANIYIPDPGKIDFIAIIFSVGGSSFVKYFTINVNGTGLHQGWNKVVLRKEAFGDGGTGAVDADWADIRKVRIKVVPKTGEVTEAYFDAIYGIEKTQTKAKVLITFDDNIENVWTVAKPIMDKYGFVGTSFVVTGAVGNPGRGTLQQLKNAQNCGWCIGSHTVTHRDIKTLSDTEMHDELLNSKKWLVDNGFAEGSEHFATPYGSYGDRELELIKKYYQTHRTVLNSNETIPTPRPHELRIRYPINTTTLTQFQGWVDTTIANKSVLILLYHYVQDPADKDIYVTPTMFSDMMAYLNTVRANIDVITPMDLV